MRQILSLPITNTVEFKTFERQMYTLTLGYSLARSMSYSTFRRVVLQYHLTGHPTEFKFMLENNHVISVDDGLATLYRIVEDEGHPREDDGTDSDDETYRKSKRAKLGSV